MKLSIPLLFTVLAPVFMFWSIPVHSAPIDKPNEQVEHIRLRAGELPAVKLTADILYRILTSEVAAARGYYDVAGQTVLSLARETYDPRLATRAFQFSIRARNRSEGGRVGEECVRPCRYRWGTE